MPMSKDQVSSTIFSGAPALERLNEVAEQLRPEMVQTLRQLVSIPSENLPPTGGEKKCQTFVAEELRQLGLEPDVYEPTAVPELQSHAEYWPGRNYAGRPNVNAVLKGTGGGRSLVLSGHIDTVPADTPMDWQHPPFSAHIENGRLYGRGAWDMKAGIAMNLTILRAMRLLGLRLRGDICFETVVDEEYGGVNGTLAARLRGYHSDAAVITESTSMRICPAQRGGRTLHIQLRGRGGILGSDATASRVVEQLGYLLSRLPEFAVRRSRRVPIDPYYSSCPEPFAVWVTNIATGRWGWTQPITVPDQCRLELYWQSMPSETREEVELEFYQWWNEILDDRTDLFPERPNHRTANALDPRQFHPLRFSSGDQLR